MRYAASALRLRSSSPALRSSSQPRPTDGGRWLIPFALVGLVGAVAFAVENAHQSWGAVFLQEVIGALVGVTALAPATFAAFSAVTRFATSYPRGLSPVGLLVGGAVVACGGTLLFAASHAVFVTLTGSAVAGVGTSVRFPTFLSRHRPRSHSEVAGQLSYRWGP